MMKVLFILFALLISTNAFAYNCMTDDFGHVVCGGNCMKDDFGHVQCSDTDRGTCAKDDFGYVTCVDPSQWDGPMDSMKDNFGHVNFGYNCKKDDFGYVHCAKTEDGVCVKDGFGHVECHDPARGRGHGR